MKNKFLPLDLSLQFFASVDASDNIPSTTETTENSAITETENGTQVQASADNTNGNQPEEEFEKLIKGGRFENAFQKRVQGIIDKRFKHTKSLEETMAKQQPLFDFLSKKYGIDSSDPQLILEKLQSENNSNNNNEANKVKENAEKHDASVKSEIIASKAKTLSKRWAAEGEQLKKIFPSFDFKNELKNPMFVSLLKSGMPLRKVYTAVHSDELLKNAVSGTAKKVAEQTLKSIRAQGSRVAENGLYGGAGIIRKTDVSSLSGQEIRNILKQVENGSKIRF